MPLNAHQINRCYFHSVWKSPKMSHLIFSIFSINFCSIKSDMSSNTFRPQAASGFFDVECDFFCDFQTLCTFGALKNSRFLERPRSNQKLFPVSKKGQSTKFEGQGQTFYDLIVGPRASWCILVWIHSHYIGSSDRKQII